MKKNVSIVGIVLAVIIVAYGGDYYMRTTWDNHIVSDAPEFFILKYGEKAKKDDPSLGSYSTLSQDDIKALPDKYKKGLDLIQEGDQYVLKSHNNQPVKKTIRTYKSTWMGNRIEKPRTYFDFKNADKTLEISIATDQYIHYSCAPLGKEGNAYIRYALDNGNYLNARVHVGVYENLVQFLLCK